MTNFDTKRIATNGLLTILSLMVIFHLLIILGVIPFEMVWGGRLKDQSQMLSFEAISVTINLIMLGAVALHAGLLKVKLNRMVIKTALWTMVALFLVNTIGNMYSNNEMEKLLFTPVTLLLAIFSLRIAVSKDKMA